MTNREYTLKLYLFFKNTTKILNSLETRGILIYKKISNEDIDFLKELESNNKIIFTDYAYENKTNVDLKDLNDKDKVILTLSPSLMKTKFNFALYLTFSDFIEKNNTKIETKEYYIIDKEISSFKKNNNKHFEIYEHILKLQKILEDIADNFNAITIPYEYTFFDTKKINIISTFSEDDIEFIISENNNFGHTICKLFDDLELKHENK